MEASRQIFVEVEVVGGKAMMLSRIERERWEWESGWKLSS
jgi:hypothetical protein